MNGRQVLVESYVDLPMQAIRTRTATALVIDVMSADLPKDRRLNRLVSRVLV